MDEATALLTAKLSGAKQKMEDCEEDLDFLREQVTVCMKAFSPPFPPW